MDQQFYILLFVFTVIVLWLNSRLNRKNRKLVEIETELRAERKKRKALETENLKFQLQPHTLNNLIANLKVVASKLNKGLDSLTETLNYILYKGNNQKVSVLEELGFVREYLRLNELFISEIDSIKLELSQVDVKSYHFNNPSIPHLITGYFIENAFKHGDTNHKEFLRVEIKLSHTDFELYVVNKIKQKPADARIKGGIGIGNMRKRLDLLSPGKYKMESFATDSEFHSRLTLQLS